VDQRHATASHHPPPSRTRHRPCRADLPPTCTTELRLQDTRLVYLGDDQTGVALEVMASPAEEALMVIHAMPMRDEYRTA